MLILDLWGISFHGEVVFGLGKNLLFKSILGRCEDIIAGAAEAGGQGGHDPLEILPEQRREQKQIEITNYCWPLFIHFEITDLSVYSLKSGNLLPMRVSK